MNYFKRAMASLKRRKGKSLILFAVIFILGNVMAGAIAIDQGTKSVESTIKKKLGAVATVTQDYEKIDKDGQADEKVYESASAKPPKPKVLKEIGDLDEVNYFDYSVQSRPMTEKLKMVQSKDENFQIGEPGMNWFNLKGVNFNEILDSKNNIIEMKDGRVFEKDEIKNGKAVVVISEEVAKENNLRVGDKMTIDYVLQDYNVMYGGMSGGGEESDGEETKADQKKIVKDVPVEVIGTFKVLQAEKGSKKKSQDDKMMDSMNYYERVNAIYAPNDFVQKLNKEMATKNFEEFPQNFEGISKEEFKKNLEEDFGSATYILKKPEMVEDFRIKAEKILTDNKAKYSKILISSDKFDQVAGPVKGMSKISKLVLIISVLASILIITLVTILFLRDRKHELGIYLALGEKRSKVIAQIVIEVVTVAIIAITISVFTGNMLAKGFSNSLMQTQKTEQSENAGFSGQDDWQLNQLTNNSVSEDDVIDAYQISLNASYIILFYVVGIGVVLISTVAPLVYIMRLNPKKIMM
ncbi:ABC transporter permease [Vagococcus sp.]|uniref:ABC transporter, permease protein n=2 Tax=Vagococcus fluvialis TaxID=2738 RepID=A0A1X6WND6_9ENTE|nr:ABC transporter permease [Vagococcus sp.]SLM85742.1 ABC transporter, permease protein [Vagococcus fluvialis bH819]